MQEFKCGTDINPPKNIFGDTLLKCKRHVLEVLFNLSYIIFHSFIPSLILVKMTLYLFESLSWKWLYQSWKLKMTLYQRWKDEIEIILQFK